MRHRTGRSAGAEQPDGWRDRLRSRRPAARNGRRSGDDPGFTLVEIVMTIVLLSMTIIPIISATFTSVKASATSREVAQVETVLQNAADRINRAPNLCDYTVYAQAAALAQSWKASQVTTTNQYYIPGATALLAGTWATGPTGSSACPGTTRTARLIQMITVTVATETGEISRSIKVVKSDV